MVVFQQPNEANDYVLGFSPFVCAVTVLFVDVEREFFLALEFSLLHSFFILLSTALASLSLHLAWNNYPGMFDRGNAFVRRVLTFVCPAKFCSSTSSFASPL
jgi:hypothetical protein